MYVFVPVYMYVYMIIKGTEYIWQIFHHFYKGDNFCDFMFAFLHITPHLNRAYFKRKEFPPTGRKFFPFKVGPFSEGRQINLNGVTSPENIFIPLERRKRPSASSEA